MSFLAVKRIERGKRERRERKRGVVFFSFLRVFETATAVSSLDLLFLTSTKKKTRTKKNISITVAGKPVAIVSDPALLVEASALPKPAAQHSGTSAALAGPEALESVPDVSSSSASAAVPPTAAAARAAFDSACSKKAAAGPGGYLAALADAGDALTAALIGAGPDETVDMADLLERAAVDAALAGAVGVVSSEENKSAAALDSAAFKAKRPQPEHELLGAIRAARAAAPATALLSSSSCPAAAPAVTNLRAKVAGLATELESRGAPKADDASAGAALVRSGLSGAELSANLTTSILHGMISFFLFKKVDAKKEKKNVFSTHTQPNPELKKKKNSPSKPFQHRRLPRRRRRCLGPRPHGQRADRRRQGHARAPRGGPALPR